MWFNFSADLEDEIVHDILIRLPVRSLSRFKCVSKLWDYAISHPTFLRTQISVLFTTHYAVRGGHFENVDRCSDRLKHRLLHFVETQSPMRSCSLRRDKKPWADLYDGCSRDPGLYFITNSCHGLVVIGINTSLYLFNPSTNFLIKVLQLDRLADRRCIVRGGFCYDDTSNDYKVVLTLKYENRGNRDGLEFVLVGSLKRKRWSSNGPVGFQLRLVDMGPVVNGRLHCIARPSTLTRFDGARTVYHFEPRSNIFEELSMPKPRHNDEDAVFSLGVLDDRLVLCRKGEMDIEEYGSMEVMVMKEYGVSESWTTLFVISNVDLMEHLSFNENFTLFAKNREVYIVNGRLVAAYDPSTDTFRNVKFVRGKSNGFKIDAAVCLDVSLVQPKGLEWDPRIHQKLATSPE